MKLFSFHSIGSKSVQHMVLVTMLIMLSLIATSYIVVVGTEHKTMINEVSAVFNTATSAVNAYKTATNDHRQSIIDTIAPYVQNQDEVPLQTIEAIFIREQLQSTYLQGAKLYTAVEYAALNVTEPITINTSTNIITQWHAVGAYMLQLQFTLEPVIRAIELANHSTLYPVTGSLTVLQTEPNVTFNFTDEHVNILPGYSSHIERTESVVPYSQFSAFDTTNKIELIDASSVEFYTIFTAGVGAVHSTALQLLAWLLIVSAPLLVLTGILANWVSKSITKPIEQIATNIKAYLPNVQEYVPTISTNNELQELDTAIANIAADLSAQHRQLQTQVERTSAEVMQYSDTEHAIFDAIALSILVVDNDGIIKEANRTAAILLGADITQIIHTSIYNRMPLNQKQVELSKQLHPVYKALLHKQEVRIHPDEHMSIRLPKEPLPVRIIITPIKTNNGSGGAVVVIQDASDEYKVEQLKNEFIAVASHQLRTPLASIQWYSELLSSEGAENFTNQQREFMVELRLASQKMSNIINELMDASRLHDGRIEVRPEDVDVPTLLQTSLMEFKAMAEVKQATLVFSSTEKILKAHTDPVLLNIIVQNIISNAIKYSKPNGTVRIALRQKAEDMVIEVHDNGIGIPQKDTDHIFQKMYRGSNAKKVSTDGSGLGLYATRKIVRILNGTITFVSNPDTGTTFTVHLPLKQKH